MVSKAICHPDRKLQGKGLCGSCYQMKWRREVANENKYLTQRRDNYRRRRIENPEREAQKARSYLIRQYGISVEDFDTLAKYQNYQCAICGNKKELHIDHDHVSGKVRGLLCKRCNTALGGFMDNPEIMLNAIEYIKIPTWTNFTSAA